jgi:hypothetical protein
VAFKSLKLSAPWLSRPGVGRRRARSLVGPRNTTSVPRLPAGDARCVGSVLRGPAAATSGTCAFSSETSD